MIEVIDLVFQYPSDGRRVLNGINLRIDEGECLSIMGKNGSGKTTLARCLNGLYKPTSGKVMVDGMDTADPSRDIEIRRRVGLVFQNPDSQIVSTTVEREIAFGLENLGMDPERMHKEVEGVLQRFRLEKYRNRPPHLLSGGEKQLLALASVLAMRPKYLILDEPTSLLDPRSRREMLSFIWDLRGVTPILVTQFPEEALLTNRLIILKEGRILYDDQPERIFEEVDELKQLGLSVPLEFELRGLVALEDKD